MDEKAKAPHRKKRRGAVLLKSGNAKKHDEREVNVKLNEVELDEQGSCEDNLENVSRSGLDSDTLNRKLDICPAFKKNTFTERRSSFGGISHVSAKGGQRNTLGPSVDTRASQLRGKSETRLRVDQEKHMPANETLTKQQVSAFKEAFDLFDNNGGGTIDALELKETLESVGILLDEAEIHDVMMRLDKDGNGEIDFDEFLDLMTNTEMFLEAFASRHDGSTENHHKERDVLLFDALTEFMKKSALKDAHEIVGYYAKKYKKVVKSYNANKGAHVVGHYADGARLIGLTEKQIVQQLK
uniref:EF-hand domain-containing protein n=1 Tax=Ciona savignyi TaxID=51511 RepID=H2ZDZ9_CIOSA